MLEREIVPCIMLLEGKGLHIQKEATDWGARRFLNGFLDCVERKELTIFTGSSLFSIFVC